LSRAESVYTYVCVELAELSHCSLVEYTCENYYLLKFL